MFALSSEQLAIVGHAGGSAVVRAGAGTGKTETLTQRVLKLLIDGIEGERCELEELVVLTFTEKAAAEMRQRIYQGILGRLYAESDTPLRPRLERLRAGFVEGNRIGTFDSFNHQLLALYPERAGVPPGFEPMNSHDERTLHAQLVRTFWDHLEEGNEELRQAFFELLNHYERRRVLQLAATLAEAEQVFLRQLATLPHRPSFERELARLAELGAARITARYARKMLPHWQRYNAAIPAGLPSELDNVLRDLEQLRYLGCEWLTQQTKFQKRRVPPDWKELCAELEETLLPLLRPWRELDKKLHEALAVFAEIGQPGWSDADWESRRIIGLLATCAQWWKAQRQAVCQANRWASFTDMQRAAARLLDDPAVRETLRQGCRHILIDEFQDTNMAQWEFIDSFRSDNVLIIGDEKQAIYRFRGGDITVFQEVRQQLSAANAPYELSISRRSTSPIVDFCNRLFAELLPQEGEQEDFEAAFQALHAGEAGDTREGVWALRPNQQAESAGDGSDERASSSLAIAALLSDLQNDATSEGASLRQPALKSISDRICAGEAGVVGVLFRTHSRKAQCEAALQAAGVRYASVQGIGFFQSEQAHDALNLLRFWFDAHDSISLAGILRSPLVGLSDRALLELSLLGDGQPLWIALKGLFDDASPKLEELVANDADRHALRLGYPRLRRWRDLARLQPISEALELVLREGELPFYDGLLPNPDQRLQNWAKVVEVVRDRENRGSGSLRELADYFMAQEQEEEKEADAALPDSGAIQLMTVYAAKGLGFPMVVLAQTDDVPPIDRETLKRGAFPTRADLQFCVKPNDSDDENDPILWTILREEDRAQRDAEFRRLLYVACTRAKGQLVIAQPSTYRPGSWAEFMAPFSATLPVVQPNRNSQSAAQSVPMRNAEPLDFSLLKPLDDVRIPLNDKVEEDRT